jgi:hypothetical protein
VLQLTESAVQELLSQNKAAGQRLELDRRSLSALHSKSQVSSVTRYSPAFKSPSWTLIDHMPDCVACAYLPLLDAAFPNGDASLRLLHGLALLQLAVHLVE